ncbi:hypothetical protein GGF31_004411 [Allomyces arbusculus]|nr:hypothetical protein GGF31_004411 [Allomyces arbusculus]
MSAPAAPRPPPAPARPAPVVALNLMHESPPPDPGDPVPQPHQHQYQHRHEHHHGPAATTRPMTGTVPLESSCRSASTSSMESSSSSHSSRAHDGGGSGHGQDSTAAAAPPTPRQPPFVCAWGDCTAAFYVLGDLTRHVDTHYTYTKGALCRWKDCWRRVGFEGGRHMQFHMNSHTGARPFQCPVCLKRFSTVPNFRTHSKNVHGSQNAQYTHIEYDPATEPLQVTPHNNTNNTGKKYNTLKSENCGQNRKRVKRPRSSNRTSSTSSADSARGGTMPSHRSASSSASGSPMVTDDDEEDELHDSPDEQTDEDDELFVSDDEDDDGPVAASRARAKRPRLDHEPPSPPKTPNGTRSLSRPRRVSRRMSDTVAVLASPTRSMATSPVGRRRRTSIARIEDAVMLDEEQVETIALDGTIHQQRDEDEARRRTSAAREALMPWSSSSPAVAGATTAVAGAAAPAHGLTRSSTLRFVSAQPRTRAPSRASDDSGTASSLPPSDDDYDDDEPPFVSASASSAVAEAEMAARGRPRERARPQRRPRPPSRRGSSESIEMRRGVAATRAHLHRAGHDETSPTPAVMPRRRADSGIGMEDGDEPTGLRRSLRTRTAAPSRSSSRSNTSVVPPTRYDTRRARNEEDYDQIDEENGNHGPGNAPISRYPTLRRRHAAAVAAATNTNLATGNYAAVAAAAAHADLTTPRSRRGSILSTSSSGSSGPPSRSRSPAASKTGPTMSSLYKSLRAFARAARTMRQRDMAGTLDRNAPVPAEIAAFLGSTQFMPSRQLRRELRALEKTCRAKMQDLKRAAAAPVVATADEEDVDLTDDGMSDPGAVSPVLAPVREFADEDDDPDVEMEAAQTVEAAMDLLTLCSRPVSPTLTRADSADGYPLATPSAPTMAAATIVVHPPEFSLNAPAETMSPVSSSLHAFRPPSPPQLRALANAPPVRAQSTHLATPPTPMAASPDLGSATPLALPSPKVPIPTGPLALSDHHSMSLPPLRNHHLPPRPMAPALVLPRPYVGDRVPLVALKRVSSTPSTTVFAAEFPSPAATPANSLRPRNGLC